MSIDDEEFPHTPPRRGYVSSCFKYAHFHVCINRRITVPKTPVSSRTPSRYLYMFDIIQVFDSQISFRKRSASEMTSISDEDSVE
jgi:hypothetical protein